MYAYEIVPPEPSRRLDTIRALLEGENLSALGGPGAWAGRLILELKVVHILIVTDTPLRNRDINWKLEAELDRLHATFSVTKPLAVPTARVLFEELPTANGNGR